MEKWFVIKANNIEVKTSSIRKVKTTGNLLDLGTSQISEWAEILKIFSTKEEAQAFFEKQKEFCETSVKYKYRSWYITFDAIGLCSITEEEYKELFGDDESLNDLSEGDGFGGDMWEWYIAPYTDFDEDDPDADVIEIEDKETLI